MQPEIETRTYGYARVSTEDQDLRHQIKALDEYGCFRVFQEKTSGRNMKREQFNILKLHLQAGDKLVVTKLDRLGRNLIELEQFVTWLDSLGVELVCLFQQVDFKSASGRAMFRMQAAFSQMESELASERTKLGLDAARAAGRQVGAITKRATWEHKDPKKAQAILDDCADPSISINQIAKKYRMSVATVRKNWTAELAEAGKTKAK